MSYARTPRDIFLVTTNVHAHSSKMYFSTPEKYHMKSKFSVLPYIFYRHPELTCIQLLFFFLTVR